MEKPKFARYSKVYVKSIRMCAWIESVVGKLYNIRRADGKHDIVMENGLEEIKKEDNERSD